MRLCAFCLFLVSAFFSLTSAVSADVVPNYERWKFLRTITPEGYACSHAKGPITVDGRLDEPSWKAAPWTNSFVDLQGTLKPLPRFTTRVKMLWDDTYFYIGAYLEEPHVWGTLLFHDQVMFYENDFEVFIDPDSDNHEYYEFEMSPLAALWDLYLPAAYKDMEGQAPDQAWNMPGTKLQVWVDGTLNDPRDIDRGWSVEFAIPWSSLAWKAHRSCPPREGDTWRANFYRAEYPPEIVTSDRTTPDIQNNAYKRREAPVVGRTPDQWVWSPQGTDSIHCPEMWGYVQFTTAAPGKGKYRPDPLLEARRVLYDIYYSQRDFREKNGKWAATLKDLGPNYSGNTALAGEPVIEASGDGYIARIVANLSGGKTKKMSIRQNALVREE